jgi:ribosomal-protein-alanine N-acetyltransferase
LSRSHISAGRRGTGANGWRRAIGDQRPDETKEDGQPAELRTERLLLRPFEADDVEDALAYRDDEDFARFLPHIPQPFTRSDAEAFVQLNMSEPWDRSPTFAVVLDGRVIGTVSFEVDAEARSALLGYAIGRAWWHQGIATEAARAAVAWAATAFGLVRIWAATDARNLRSVRVLEKLGMQREGIRAGDRAGRGGEVVEEVVYGLDIRPQ